MKFYLSLILLLGINSIFSSCKSNSTKYHISMRLAKGDKFNVSTNTKMKYEMEVMGVKQSFGMDNSSEAEYDVVDSSAAGVEMMLTIKNQSTKMDMGKAGPQERNLQTDSLSRLMIGKKINFKVKDGKVSDLRGWEDLTASSDSLTKSISKKFMTEETFSQMSGMMFDIYPPIPVSIGDKWTKNSKFSMAGMPISVTTKYRLKEVKDGLVYIDIDGSFDAKESEVPMLPGMKMKFSGPTKGSATLRLNDGYLNESKNDFDIKAEGEMAGQKMLMKMKGTAVSKGK